MRISKLYLAVCAAALGASIMTIRADDNPAQAAARAALEDKMRALNSEPAHTNPPMSAPATPQKPAPPAASAMPASPPPAQTQPPAEPGYSAPAGVTPSGVVVQAPTNPPPATTTMPAPPKAVTPVKTHPAAANPSHGLFTPVPPPSGSSMGAATPPPQPSTNVQTQVTPVAPPPHVVKWTPPQNPNALDNREPPGLKPIEAPPLPISSGQQARLQALLEKYNANEITPAQYQVERAKILAEH